MPIFDITWTYHNGAKHSLRLKAVSMAVALEYAVNDMAPELDKEEYPSIGLMVRQHKEVPK